MNPPPPLINPIVWKAIVGPLKNIPREGSVVYYYPRIHAAATPTPIIPQLLPEKRVARVVRVHLGVQGDDVYARFQLAPIQGQNPENEEGGDVADGIQGGGIVFVRTLTQSDIGSLGSCYISMNLAHAMFPPIQLPPPDASNTTTASVPIVASDVGGAALPGLQLKCNFQSGRHGLAGTWSAFRNRLGLAADDQIVFVRVGDHLTIGTRRRGGAHVTLQEVTMAFQNCDENREFTFQYFPDNGEEYVLLKSLVDGGNAAAAGWHVGQYGQAVEFHRENEIGGVVTVNGFVQDINVKQGENSCDVRAGNKVYQGLRPWKLTPLMADG